MYSVIKTYTHAQGLSAAFRQWRAKSHCRFVHGYALQIAIEFEAETLNGTNWVIDFGGLKPLKSILEKTFDHKLLIARDDPLLQDFKSLAHRGAADIVIVEATGCEAFAELIYKKAVAFLKTAEQTKILDQTNLVRVAKVTVSEHGGNSAAYTPPTNAHEQRSLQSVLFGRLR